MKKIIFGLAFLFLIISCAKENKNVEQKTQPETQKITQEEKMPQEKEYNYVTIGADSMLVGVIETNMGTIEVELYPNKTPKTVTNFVTLAEENFYDSVTFHRVIDGFMIQGGDPSGTGMGGKSIYDNKPFEDEFDSTLKHDSPGILSMANRGPNTNTSQFFITLVPTPHLDGKHTVFGKVINGMDVVRKIGKVKTQPPYNKPVEPVVMEKVYIERRAKK